MLGLVRRRVLLLMTAGAVAACGGVSARDHLSASVADATITTPSRLRGLTSFCYARAPTDCLTLDHRRFTVAVSPGVLRAGERAQVVINRVIAGGLGRIGSLLPGPHTEIAVVPGTNVIPGRGVLGFTNPETGQVTITVNTRQHAGALKHSLTTYLVEALSHEVDHSVRIEAGPGFGTTLLEELVTEGISSAFDIQVQPTDALPWIHALSPQQERTMWARARPLLNQTGLYDQWFFGRAGVPYWTAFQIGYHIVRDYLNGHPNSTAASIVRLNAASVLDSADFAP